MIIGIAGKARHGKNTSAKFIGDYFTSKDILWKEFSFANEVKKICLLFGAKEEDLWGDKRPAKARRLMQVVATEAGREYNSNIWIDKLFEQKKFQEIEKQGVAIITDVRFINEVEQILIRKGKIILIERPNAPSIEYGANHVSETSIDDIKKKFLDKIYYIYNKEGSLENLRKIILELLIKMEA